MQKPMSTVNHVASKSSQSQNKTEIPNSISKNADKQIEPCNSTSKRFHLDGHFTGFRPQTQKLDPPYKTPRFTWVNSFLETMTLLSQPIQD